MTNIDKHFKGQLEDENVLCIFRRHWIKVLPRLLFFTFAFLATALVVVYIGKIAGSDAFQGNIALKSSFVLGFALFSFMVHHEFLAIFHYYLHTVLVTDFRIVDVDKSVFFHDSKDSVDLSKIQDIQKLQNGIVENLMNFGSLKIVLSGTHVSMNLDLIPNPEYYFKVINRAKRNYIQKRRSIPHGGMASVETVDYEFPIPVEF